MTDFFLNHYHWLRAFHIIAVISWMAGMLYLPRLFVYHAEAKKNSEMSETFKLMEKRLLRFIMNPAMIAVWVFGLLMLWANPELLQMPWMHVKLLFVLLLSGLHGFFAKTVKVFARDENRRSTNFYRWLNEAPTALMIVIVVMVVARPF